MRDSSELVTVSVPAFNGGAVVFETLESIQRQTHANFKVLISVDLSTDDTVDICRGFLADPRFRLIEQDRHLGWVDNCNWLLARVETPYSFLLPHDDLLEESYIERLLETANAHPTAAVVYSDIQTLGLPEELRLVQHSIRGAEFTRVLTYLIEHYNGVAWRGLMRLDALRAAGPIAHNAVDDFAAETVWLFQLVMRGEFVRVTEPLYTKRYLQGSVHGQWLDRNREGRVQAWREHCLALACEALDRDIPPGQKSMIAQALIFRLVRANSALGPFTEISELSQEEREEMLTDFVSRLAKVSGVDSRALIPNRDQLRYTC